MKKRLLLIMTVLFMGFPFFSACGEKGDSVVLSFEKDENTLLTIGDTKCSIAQIKLMLINYRNIYGNAYGITLYDNGDEDFSDYILDMTVKETARTISMDYLAEDQGVQLTEQEVERAEEAAAAYFDTLSEAELEYTGIVEEEVRDLYVEYALATKLYDVLTGTVNYEVSEDEARVMQLLVILTSDKAISKEIKKSLADDGDFTTLATQYNELPSIEMTVNRTDLPPEVTEVAYKLAEGETTGPIETDTGYYFLQCLQKNVEDLTEANKKTIAKQREKETFDDIYDEYVTSLNSVVNQDLLDALEMPTEETLATDSFFSVFEENYGS